MSLNLALTAASSVMQNHYASQINPPSAHESSGPIAHPLDAVALNPQPLPPRELAMGPLLNRFDAVALNPQPLPPRELALGSLLNRFDAVALNPQPLPPRELAMGSLLNRFDAVALNPQPLPPREAMSLSDRIGMVADEWCGTVPRRLPHLPPPPPPLGTASR